MTTSQVCPWQKAGVDHWLRKVSGIPFASSPLCDERIFGNGPRLCSHRLSRAARMLCSARCRTSGFLQGVHSVNRNDMHINHALSEIARHFSLLPHRSEPYRLGSFCSLSHSGSPLFQQLPIQSQQSGSLTCSAIEAATGVW